MPATVIIATRMHGDRERSRRQPGVDAPAIGSVAADEPAQKRQQHQTGAVGACHQKRPQHELQWRNPKADPARVFLAHQLPDRECRQGGRACDPHGGGRHGGLEPNEHRHHQPDREGMADGERRQRAHERRPRERSCSASATANSHPIAGLMP